MSSERQVGKPSPARLHELIGQSVGKPSDRVLVGPGPGLDAAIIELDDGRVMAVAEDPIFPAPGLPLEIMGWFTVHIGASDVAVTGVVPAFMTYTLLLPGSAPESDATCLIRAISAAASDLGITIVGGHTGWYDAVTIPTVGGVTVWGFADRDRWISPGGARPGDTLLITKGPAIEAAALLGVIYRDRLRGTVADDLLETVCGRTGEITVVNDALTAYAAAPGAVHAMHDATERGVIGGLAEMAAASGTGIFADFDAVPVPADIAAVADALGFDPWQAISEGTLLAAVVPAAVGNVLDAWAAVGIDGFVLGEFRSLSSSSAPLTVRRNGRTRSVTPPEIDPFWDLFFAGLAG